MKVIADIEVSIRHDHSAYQRRNRSFAVEWMRTMDQQAGFNCLLAGDFRIHCANDLAPRRCRRTSSARNHASAGRGRINLQAARHLEWLQKIAEATLVRGFPDQIQGVFTLYNRFT